ncbi:nicotinate-nucleotide adenylyltransferase [Rubrivivax sp. RP6-9]|uniref:nicotinate-nucleotide adenylyltransferase n=1 Tax=Rubrivivax sp. RP6-9 TaxID=3415750 RepID=UPI003CC63FB5
MKRIGLFGGTFDPVHNAHVALARSALVDLQLDAVRWIPAGQPWQKDRQVTDAVHRAAMVQLAIAGEPRFVLDRIEIDRAGPSYTLDTVRALQAAQPGQQWFLLIGQDQYAGLHTWNQWQELLTRVTLAVANRPGAAPAVHADVLRFPHRSVPLAMLDISSTDIRRRAALGLDISTLVPADVAGYIDQHRLYAAAIRN